MWNCFLSFVKKDFQILIAGKFLIVAAGSLILYTLFINFGYVSFMEAEPYQVYLYDPANTQKEVSRLIHPVDSEEELYQALATDINGVGIQADDGIPLVIMYYGSEKADQHRKDYALSLLRPETGYTAETVGSNTPEMKQRKEMSCELLFIELIAVGFLGIASVLFKEKQMGVIRVHAVLPVKKAWFILSKLTVFLLSDLTFAALLTILNIGFSEGNHILLPVFIQTAILSLIMALVGFGCAMLLRDFKQFSLAYLVIAIFAATPVFLAANTSVKMRWVTYHPFYQLYMGLKSAYFGTPVTNSIYYIVSLCGIVLLFFLVQSALRREMGKED